MALGIAVFLGVGEPHGGSGHATAVEWVLAFSFCGSIMVAMILMTRNARPHYRALGLAVATGASYACTAALTKQVVDILADHTFVQIFARWPVYALAVFSVVGLLLNQSAFNAGHLAASLPALAVTNPILSSILGIALFEEELKAHGALQYSITALAVCVMLVGVIRLARSPFVAGDSDGHSRPSGDHARVARDQVWSGCTRLAIGSSSAVQSCGAWSGTSTSLEKPTSTYSLMRRSIASSDPGTSSAGSTSGERLAMSARTGSGTGPSV